MFLMWITDYDDSHNILCMYFLYFIPIVIPLIIITAIPSVWWNKCDYNSMTNEIT